MQLLKVFCPTLQSLVQNPISLYYYHLTARVLPVQNVRNSRTGKHKNRKSLAF